MALKNKNGKSIIKKNIQPTLTEIQPVDNIVKDEKIDETVKQNEDITITKTKHEEVDVNDELKKEVLSLKKALLSVYNKLRVYTTRNYVNSNNNNFTETNTLLGFKHENEQITIKAELVDINDSLYDNDNLKIIIKKNNEDFDYTLLEKTTLDKSSKIIFKTTQTDSCIFQIIFILTLENGEKIEFSKEVVYIAYNKVMVGYLDRHTEKYEIIKNNDIIPSSTCKGNVYEIKYHKLPITKENHGERICLYIPEDVYNNDNGEYMFYYNGFHMPLFLEEKIKLNNENYYAFVSTSYYENDDNNFYDFSIKIEVY